MKLLLVLAALFLGAGCGTTPEGRKTFLGVAKYDKERCTHNQWVLKKKRIVYQKCFK